MITQRKLNLMKVNSELRLARIKMYREKQEMGDNPKPIMVPPPDTMSRNTENMPMNNTGGENGS